MDICDQADIQTEAALAAALARRKPISKPNGRCLNCNAVIPKSQRFCDGECRSDYEYRDKMRTLGR